MMMSSKADLIAAALSAICEVPIVSETKAKQLSCPHCGATSQSTVQQPPSSATPLDFRDLSRHLFAGDGASRVWGPSGDGPPPTLYIKDEDLAPEFDYNFTNERDYGLRFERSAYEYRRPCGWDRCAFAVLGKYPDDVWLGPNGIRCESAPGEWAVSYHGTAVDNIGSIAGGGYDPARSIRQLYGPGIYSSPSVHVAEEYAKQFSHEGRKYKVVLQNRVNLAETKVEQISTEKVYFITKDPDNVRPYGVCLKEIKGHRNEEGTCNVM